MWTNTLRNKIKYHISVSKPLRRLRFIFLMKNYVSYFTNIPHSSATGEVFPITSMITCTSKCLIYDLWCHRCRNSASANPGSDQYTGKTEDSASKRFNGHKSDIITGKIYKAVAEHFHQPGHQLSDLRFLPFESVNSSDPTVLASREQYWISKKQTFNLGINRQK